MKKMKILFPDNIHVTSRNFYSLYTLMENPNFSHIFEIEYESLKILYGNYSKHKELFLKEYDLLSSLDKDDLFNYKYLGIDIFNLAQAELLSYLMSQQNWFDKVIPSHANFIFSKAYKENKEDLLLNLAATLFWLKFWHKQLKSKNYKDLSICIIFSSSLIYVKTLSYLLQNTPIKVFVIEHFFTGNHFYFEEKYSHIANNSDIKYHNYFINLKNNLIKSPTFSKHRMNTITAINKMNNKNVKQPKVESKKIKFQHDSKKTVLILGQVINDFSILETKLDNINSLEVYKQIIENILHKTDFNIIFKAHPWEKNKINLNKSITKDELYKYLYINFTMLERERIEIVEDYNIYNLFNESNYIVGICSQSLLEASYAGKKTYQLGKAFFSNKGFTYDCSSIDEFINIIKLKPLETLTLKEYSDLLIFLTVAIELHLVSAEKHGVSTLMKKLNISLKNQKINVSNNNNSILNKLVGLLVYIFSSEKRYLKFTRSPKAFFHDSSYKSIKLIGKLYK